MIRELVKCPQCNNLVKPIRKANRQSMWHKAFIPFAAYYGAFVWECPVCGYRLPKDEAADKDSAFEWQTSYSEKGELKNQFWECPKCHRKNTIATKRCSRCDFFRGEEEQKDLTHYEL